MRTSRKNLVIITALLALVPAAFAQDSAPGPKLYRWVGPDGKAHYSDDLPPEMATEARQELGKNGITLKDIGRSATPEERAAAQAKADAEAKAAEAIDKAKQNDQMLLASYPTEADLKRAYEDRIEQIAQSLKATRMGLSDEQQNMSTLLTSASNMELAGKPVPAQVVASVKLAHEQIVEQQQAETQQQAQTVNMRQEAAATLEHYRQLHSAMNTRSASTPSPANSSKD
jgi:hypothetical protein